MSGIFGSDANIDLTEFGTQGLGPSSQQVSEQIRKSSLLEGPAVNLLIDATSAAANLAGTPKITKQQWESKGYNVPGVNFNNIADSDGMVNEVTAQMYANRQRELNKANTIIQESSYGPYSVTRLGSSLMGFMEDPLNYAASFVAPEATGALGDLATGAVNKIADRYGISDVAEIASNKFIKSLSTGFTEGAVAGAPQAVGNFLDQNQSVDSAAMNALNTLFNFSVLGGGIRLAGTTIGAGRAAAFKKLSGPSKDYADSFTDADDNNLDIPVVTKEAHTTAMNLAMAQASKGKNIDVMDVLKAGYNDARGQNLTNEVSGADVYGDIAPAMKSLVEGLPDDKSELSNLKNTELNNQEEVENGTMTHNEYLSTFPERYKALKSGLDENNPVHQDALNAVNMMSSKPFFRVDPKYVAKLTNDYISSEPATFHGYSTADEVSREGLENVGNKYGLDQFDNELQDFANRDDLTDFERNQVEEISQVNEKAKLIPRLYDNVVKCLTGAS